MSKYEIYKDMDKFKENEEKQKKLKRKVWARNISILVLIIIIILLLLRSCGADNTPDTFKPILQQGNEITQTTEQQEKLYVRMPVVDDFTVSSKNPNVVLYSPAENYELFYITYTFTDADGNVIYQSNPAEGGTQWGVNFKELLPVGEHEVRVQLSSMYCDTGKPANGIGSTITITVTE